MENKEIITVMNSDIHNDATNIIFGDDAILNSKLNKLLNIYTLDKLNKSLTSMSDLPFKNVDLFKCISYLLDNENIIDINNVNQNINKYYIFENQTNKIIYWDDFAKNIDGNIFNKQSLFLDRNHNFYTHANLFYVNTKLTNTWINDISNIEFKRRETEFLYVILKKYGDVDFNIKNLKYLFIYLMNYINNEDDVDYFESEDNEYYYRNDNNRVLLLFNNITNKIYSLLYSQHHNISVSNFKRIENIHNGIFTKLKYKYSDYLISYDFGQFYIKDVKIDGVYLSNIIIEEYNKIGLNYHLGRTDMEGLFKIGKRNNKHIIDRNGLLLKKIYGDV